ncbi:hypothetical protein BDQ17DRAFT_1328023 [Cyathus striatus]|nr:hypothetical protein BDQ17DRAFT_1328023 [Cyathus striatus]
MACVILTGPYPAACLVVYNPLLASIDTSICSSINTSDYLGSLRYTVPRISSTSRHSETNFGPSTVLLLYGGVIESGKSVWRVVGITVVSRDWDGTVNAIEGRYTLPRRIPRKVHRTTYHLSCLKRIRAQRSTVGRKEVLHSVGWKSLHRVRFTSLLCVTGTDAGGGVGCFCGRLMGPASMRYDYHDREDHHALRLPLRPPISPRSDHYDHHIYHPSPSQIYVRVIEIWPWGRGSRTIVVLWRKVRVCVVGSGSGYFLLYGYAQFTVLTFPLLRVQCATLSITASFPRCIVPKATILIDLQACPKQGRAGKSKRGLGRETEALAGAGTCDHVWMHFRAVLSSLSCVAGHLYSG